MNEQEWYAAFVEVCNTYQKLAPEMETVITYFLDGSTPQEAFDLVFPPTAVAPPLPDTLPADDVAIDISDLQTYSDLEVALQVLADNLQVPKVTENMVLSKVIKKTFTVMPGRRTVVCEITMQNGFTHRGEASMLVDGSDYEMGKVRSLMKAVQAAWPFEAYLVREQLYQQSLRESGLLIE